jgi:putative membrane protein
MRPNIPLIQLAVFLVVLIWSGIDPVKRSIWFYEVVPAVALVLILLLTYRRHPLTMFSYWIVFFSVLIMLVGGHYTYGEEPIFTALKNYFHFQRNNFDRLGHVFQGMIITAIVREIFIRTNILRRKALLPVIIGSLSVTFSSLYELFELAIGKIFDPNIQNFLGYQGDIFDSHWDIACATLGSILILLLGKIQDKQLAAIKKQ